MVTNIIILLRVDEAAPPSALVVGVRLLHHVTLTGRRRPLSAHLLDAIQPFIVLRSVYFWIRFWTVTMTTDSQSFPFTQPGEDRSRGRVTSAVEHLLLLVC